MKKMKSIISFALIIFFIFGNIIGCERDLNNHAYQNSIEGTVEKVQYSYAGGGFLHPGSSSTHIYFSDGRTATLNGILPPSQQIKIGKYNKIWYDDNSAHWIRSVEILTSHQPEL